MTTKLFGPCFWVYHRWYKLLIAFIVTLCGADLLVQIFFPSAEPPLMNGINFLIGIVPAPFYLFVGLLLIPFYRYLPQPQPGAMVGLDALPIFALFTLPLSLAFWVLYSGIYWLLFVGIPRMMLRKKKNMTFYNLHVPRVKPGLETTTTPAALDAKKRRQNLLREIRQRRREQYKRFLVPPLASELDKRTILWNTPLLCQENFIQR